MFCFILLPVLGEFFFLLFGIIPFTNKKEKLYINELNKYLKSDSKDTNGLYKYSTNSLPNMPVSTKNYTKIIKNNSDILEKYIELIESAKSTILLQTYLFSKGLFFNMIVNSLIKKAKEGVKVIFMYDWVGSYRKYNNSNLKALAKAGVEVCMFNPKGINVLKSSTNFRSHEKMLIIDNNVCFYGSSNISDEYINIRSKKNSIQDTNYIIKGSILNSFTFKFLYNYFIFSNSKKKNVDKIGNFFKYKKDKTDGEYKYDYQLIYSGPNHSIKHIENTLIYAFSKAKKSIKIVCPFFSPTVELRNAIAIAKIRGVEVSIILPGYKDKGNIDILLNRKEYKKLIDDVNVYEYSSFIHSKFIIIDDKWIIFGSNNLDNRSLRINFENALICKSKNLASEFTEIYDKFLKKSTKINKDWIKENINWINKISFKIISVYRPLV